MTTCLQCLCLVHKKVGSKNDTIADDINLATLENTRGNAAQNIFLTFEFQCVTCIWATLETCNHIITRGQYIDHFSFSFIAPLQTEQDVNFTFVHFSVFFYFVSFLFSFGESIGLDTYCIHHRYTWRMPRGENALTSPA